MKKKVLSILLIVLILSLSIFLVACNEGKDKVNDNNDGGVNENNEEELIKIEGVEPTCETDGSKEYYKDKDGKFFEDQEGIKGIIDIDTWKIIPALGHDWVVTYDWNIVNLTCTATRTCTKDESHVETITATITSEELVAPTCILTGKKKCTATFSETWASTQTKEVEIAALGHSYGEVTYTWNVDNTECTATRTCANDTSHVETITATITSEELVTATCLEKGKTKYTATFSEEWATTQTKELENIAALGHDWNDTTYTWSVDNTVCTATRICKNDSKHIEKVESISINIDSKVDSTVNEKGVITYKAKFADGSWAVTQSKKVDIEKISVTPIHENPAQYGKTGTMAHYKGADNKLYVLGTDGKYKETTETDLVISELKGKVTIYKNGALISNSIEHLKNTDVTKDDIIAKLGLLNAITSYEIELYNSKETIENNKILDITEYAKNTQNVDVYVVCTSKYEMSFVTDHYSVYRYNSEDSNIIIPDTWNDAINGEFPVTIIGESAFESLYNSSVEKKLILGKNIEEIGNFAFQHIQLVGELIIPKSVKLIGQAAFNENNITSIKFEKESNVKEIRSYAFGNNKIISIEIPKSVTTLSNPFANCQELTKVTVAEGNITYKSVEDKYIIQTETVDGKTTRTIVFVTIDASMPTSGFDAIGYRAFAYNNSNELVIPEGVTSIVSQAFTQSKCTRIIFPTTLEETGWNVINECPNVQEVIIPGDKLKNVGLGLFRDSGSIKRIFIKQTSLKGTWDPEWIYNSGSIEDKAFLLVKEVPATCTENGIKEHYKNAKGLIYVETTPNIFIEVTAADLIIEKGIHELDPIIPEVKATFDTPGTKSYYHCNKCNKYFEDEACTKEITDITIWKDNIPTSQREITVYENKHIESNGLINKYRKNDSIDKYDLVTGTKGKDYEDVLLYSDADCNNEIPDLKAYFIANENPVIYVLKQYKVTFDAVGGSIEPNITEEIVTYSKNYGVLPVATKQDLDFDGWYCDGIYVPDSKEYLLESNCTLIAKYFTKGLYFEEDTSYGYYQVSKFDGKSSKLIIPSTYKGKDVKVIKESVFSNNSVLEDITLPETVVEIYLDAFYNCTALKYVRVSDINTWLNINFYFDANPLQNQNASLYVNDKLLEDLVVPEGVTSINSDAFSCYKKLKSVTIPSTVTSIDSGAFENIPNLKVYINDLQDWMNIKFYSTSNPLNNVNSELYVKNILFAGDIEIPEKITNIGQYAFYNYDKITGVTIPSTITSIGGNAFKDINSFKLYIDDLASWMNIEFLEYTSNPMHYAKEIYINGKVLTELVIPNGVTVIKDYVFISNKNLTKITIPEGVEEIGNYAFNYCKSLENVEFPSTLTTIGESAFKDCLRLTSITIPSGVTTIGSYAFFGCSGLTSIEVDTLNTIYKSQDNCLLTKDGKTLVLGCKNSIIPSGVTTIFKYAFYGCSDLTSITIPEGVSLIGEQAFRGCENLTNVTMNGGVETIERQAFDGCRGLTSIIIPEGTLSIGDKAFNCCQSLTTIKLPNSIRHVGQEAFWNSKWVNDCFQKPQYMYLNNVLLGYSSNYPNFTHNPSDKNLYLRTNTTVIADIAFGMKEIETVVFNEGLINIGDSAFYYCKNIKRIYIPASVKYIGKDAFKGCENLKEINVSKDNTEYSSKDNCLLSKDGKTLILAGANSTIPEGVTFIQEGAFDNTCLTEIIIPSYVETVETSAFGWGNMNTLTIDSEKMLAKYDEKNDFSVSMEVIYVKDTITNIDPRNLDDFDKQPVSDKPGYIKYTAKP